MIRFCFPAGCPGWGVLLGAPGRNGGIPPGGMVPAGKPPGGKEPGCGDMIPPAASVDGREVGGVAKQNRTPNYRAFSCVYKFVLLTSGANRINHKKTATNAFEGCEKYYKHQLAII